MTDIPVPEFVRRLEENLASFDAEVAYQLSIEGERADLWGEIDVNVEDLRSLLADRAAQAERMARLERKLRACQWYWPEYDTSSETCADSAQEVVQNAYDYETPEGGIVAIARGGVVEVTYCAYLPPADDSDSDDDFWVEEETREAAKAKIDAELARRALSQEGSDGT